MNWLYHVPQHYLNLLNPKPDKSAEAKNGNQSTKQGLTLPEQKRCPKVPLTLIKGMQPPHKCSLKINRTHINKASRNSLTLLKQYNELILIC